MYREGDFAPRVYVEIAEPRRTLGKNHHNRPPRGSARAWYREHWPLFAARLDGDQARIRELEEFYLERELMFARVELFCVECHALLIHDVCGFFHCPYERAGVHQRARRWLEGRDKPKALGARKRAAGAPSGVIHRPLPRRPKCEG